MNKLKPITLNSFNLYTSALAEWNERTQTLTMLEDGEIHITGTFRKGDRFQINQPLDKQWDYITKLQDKHELLGKKYEILKNFAENMAEQHFSPNTLKDFKEVLK